MSRDVDMMRKDAFHGVSLRAISHIPRRRLMLPRECSHEDPECYNEDECYCKTFSREFTVKITKLL